MRNSFTFSFFFINKYTLQLFELNIHCKLKKKKHLNDVLYS